jgi:hypothetical protein
MNKEGVSVHYFFKNKYKERAMHKKSAILLTSLFLLAACGGEDTPETDASSEEPTTEAVTETEAETQTETNNDVHTYDRLVNETTFTEEYGYQAWNDYQAVIKDATFGEFTAITGENSNPEALTGTAKGEVEALFNALDLRDDVIVDEAEVTEKENLVFYRYPPAEESAYSEAALFLAESTFYFYEDNLMFSAITPGFYSLEFNEVPPAEDLMLFLTVDEIKELDSQIYTIAEMQING